MSVATAVTIGGSEAAAACGIDPYRSRVALWAEKLGLVAPKPAGEAALWGTLLQPVIAAQVGARGYDVMPAPADELRSDDWPWLIGHPDGYCAGRGAVGDTAVTGSADDISGEDDCLRQSSLPVRPLSERGILEVKTASIRYSDSWGDDDAPPAYVVQAHHYMLLTGLRWALLACLVGGQRLELRELEYNERLAEAMLERQREFLGFVEAQTPPPPDGSDSAEAVLKHLYPHANGRVVMLTPELAETAREIGALKEAAKATEIQIRTREEVLKLALGDAAVGLFEGAPLVRWSNVSARRLATARVKAEHPDVYESCCELSEYRRFTVRA